MNLGAQAHKYTVGLVRKAMQDGERNKATDRRTVDVSAGETASPFVGGSRGRYDQEISMTGPDGTHSWLDGPDGFWA